jgi:hypothetical protein
MRENAGFFEDFFGIKKMYIEKLFSLGFLSILL